MEQRGLPKAEGDTEQQQIQVTAFSPSTRKYQ